MKNKNLRTVATVGAFALLAGQSAQGVLVVYEGFDYTAGVLAGSNGGTGWGGAWSTAVAPGVTNTNVHDVAASGLTFGTLTETGLSTDRGVRNGRSSAARSLSAGAITDLTMDSSTIYFSVLMDITNTPGQTQAANSYGTILFGNQSLVDAGTVNNSGNGTILGTVGDGVGVQFYGVSGSPADYSQNGIQGVSFDNSTTPTQANGGNANGDSSSNFNNVGIDGPILVVGEIIWAANGSDDIINLYFSADSASTTPLELFSTQALDVDQTTFDTISIADGQASVFDEVRFGTDLESVTPGLVATIIPEPSSIALLGLSGLALLRRRRV